MRKVSKSRTDDDINSSTNGSVNNGDTTSNTKTDKEEPEQNIDTDENEDYSENTSKTPPKKRSLKAKSNKRNAKKKAVKLTEENEEYEVENIVNSKKIKGKLHYLIRWKGYTSENDTWEPENTLSCPELISKFNEEKGKKSSENNNSKKRKLTKKNTHSKKSKSLEWDSENADENAEYEVDRILEVHHKKNGQREFLIHWKGWSNRYDSWEPESNLNCPDLIKKFMDKVQNARSTESRTLRVAPETTRRFTLQDPTSGRRLSKRRGQRQRVRYDNTE